MVVTAIRKQPTRNDYIRFALDGLRRTSLPLDEVHWEKIARVGMLANFAYAVAALYEDRGKEFESQEELQIFVRATAERFNAILHTTSGTAERFEDFTAQMFARFKEPADPKEAGAFIIHAVVNNAFFDANNRLIAHALADYALMRAGERLPTYHGDKKRLQSELTEAFEDYHRGTEFYKRQFEQAAPITAIEPADPADAWHVQVSHLLDPRSTTFNGSYVLRGGRVGADEIVELNAVTGKFPQELAVFRPSRMALHETAAALVMRVRMDNPSRDIKQFMKDELLYSGHILKSASELDEGFGAMAEKFHTYAAFLIDDHFNILNPQPLVRDMLEEEKINIVDRIAAKEYDPHAAQSRRALREVLGDRLLRSYYADAVRDIVDKALDQYLANNPERALPMKPNGERVAWVTAGGPAAGKSSLEHLIRMERRKYGETGPFCRVNPDDYRDFLLERSGDPAYDALHSSFTHGEASRITDIIIERLQGMVKSGRAPDMWLDMVSPAGERMDLAAYGGAQVRLFAATCPAEVAVERAFDRAKTSESDKGRFVPTEVILRGHRSVSRALPETLGDGPWIVRLFDTAPDTDHYPHLYEGGKQKVSLLIASSSGYDMNLEIHEPPGFTAFLRKAGLNHTAKKPEDVVASQAEAEQVIADTMLRYVRNSLTLNFRYPSSPSPERESESLLLHFAHIGKARAHIDDLQAFIQHMGEAATAMFLSQLAQGEEMQELRIHGSLILENGVPSHPPPENGDTPEGRVITTIFKTLEKMYAERTNREREESDRRFQRRRRLQAAFVVGARPLPKQAERKRAGDIRGGTDARPGAGRGPEMAGEGGTARTEGLGDQGDVAAQPEKPAGGTGSGGTQLGVAGAPAENGSGGSREER